MMRWNLSQAPAAGLLRIEHWKTHDLAAHSRIQFVGSRRARALPEFVGSVEKMVADVNHCHMLHAEDLVAGLHRSWT
jgi:hypothetical protein